MKQFYLLIGLLGLATTCWALECYVCEGQLSNKDKCIKTTIQCREQEDACRTNIRWQQPYFWQRNSERYYNISKSCDRKSKCESDSNAVGIRCMRDWYRDWHCVECCQGDRCNFYATLGAGSVEVSMTLLSAIILYQVIQRFSFLWAR